MRMKLLEDVLGCQQHLRLEMASGGSLPPLKTTFLEDQCCLKLGVRGEQENKLLHLLALMCQEAW